MEILFILFAISVPVFYLIGLIEFFRWIAGHNRRTITASSVKKAEPEVEFNDEDDDKKKKTNKDVYHQDIETVWSNWYSNNSINLLLYIGAFLIVASASVFVGFQWQTIEGSLKAGLITLLALAFFGCGFIFYSMPKVKSAGSAFTAIGALLIPFCGVAWYNFVLKDLGASFGLVWFATSLISLIIYILLALWQKHAFYAYITCFGIFSLSLSLVNVYGLNSDFYVLSGILTTITLLISRILLNKSGRDVSYFVKPVEISENIILPFTLIYGFSIAISQNKLFSLEAASGAFLSCIYYFLAYVYAKKVWTLVLCTILFPVSILFFGKWLNSSDILLIYAIDCVPIVYLIFAYIFKQYQKTEESDLNIILGTTISVLMYIWALISNVAFIHMVIISFLPIAIGIAGSFIKEKAHSLIVSSIFAGIFGYTIINHQFNLSINPEYFSIYLTFLSTVFYFLALGFKNKEDYLKIFAFSTLFYGAISLAFSLSADEYLLCESIYYAFLAFLAAYQFKKFDIIYLGCGLLYFGQFQLFDIFHINTEFYPLMFTGLAIVFYFVMFILPEEFSDRFRKASFAGLISSPLIFGAFDRSYNSFALDPNATERNSLISAYLATAVFGFETARNQSLSFGYFTSAVAMFTILWQIKFLQHSETQFYTIPLAIYFMALAYTRRVRDDISNMKLLDTIGMCILIIPTLSQAYGPDGYKYALLLGAEGIILVFLSISYKYKVYQYAAIAAIILAVLSQTYEYVFSLPRWLIIGLAGVIFLVVATTLLFKRKEE